MNRFIAHIGYLEKDLKICIIDIYKLFNFISKKFFKNSTLYSKSEKISSSYFSNKIFTDNELREINKFKTLKKQFEFMSGRIALKILVNKKFPFISLNKIKTSRDKNGAPSLIDYPDFNISISHSGRFAAAVLSENIKTGIDIEEIGNINPHHLIHAGFSKREAKNLMAPEPYEILRLWTIKESYLKLIKKGFNESLKKVEIIGDTIYHHNIAKKKVKIKSINLSDNYILSFVYLDQQN